MAKIFISYRRADTQMAAGRIHDRLVVKYGRENVFKDVDSIPAGQDFRQVLSDWVEKTDVMLVLIGTQWLTLRDKHGNLRLENDDDFVRYEVNLGLRLSDVTVIPVLVGNASPPSSSDLPESLREIAYLNAVFIRNDPDFHRDMDRLTDSLDSYLQGEVESSEIEGANSVDTDQKPQSQRINVQVVVALITLFGVMITALCGFIQFYIPYRDSQNATQTTIASVVTHTNTVTSIQATIIPTATSQNQSSTQIVTPSNPEMVCPGSVAIDIQPGMFGQVVPGDLPNRLRLGPSLNRTTLGQIQPGDFFYVLDGPVCGDDDDFAWVEVSYQGREGWTVVSDTTTFLVEPLPENVPIINRNSDWYPIHADFQGIPMVLVPSGCFSMGSSEFSDAQPVEEICFEQPFWIDQFEVSNSQFLAFTGESSQESFNSGNEYPREQISWDEARLFCLSREARLPTEAEWEYVARGPDGNVYPWGNSFLPNGANGVHNSLGGVTEIGAYPSGASWVGAEDMSGNVWEWTHTIYDLYGSNNIYPYPYATDDGRENLRENVLRSLRGGSFLSDSTLLMATNRFSRDENLRDNEIGFRCVSDWQDE